MKLKIILFSAVFLLLILASCEKSAEKYDSDTFFAMDTFITFSAKDADAELLKIAESKTAAVIISDFLTMCFSFSIISFKRYQLPPFSALAES